MSSTNRRLTLGLLAGAAVIAVAGYFAMAPQTETVTEPAQQTAATQTPAPEPTAQTTPAPAQTPAPAAEPAPEALPAVPELVLGNPDATVTLTEYASYTCPHCARFHAEVFKPFKADYIDTGKVKFVFREVYFDRYGLWASIVARCGGEMRYFGINGVLFDKQGEWAASDDPSVVIGNLRTIGKASGLTDAQLDTCLNDQKMAEAMVARFQQTMQDDGVEGTPTLFINGTKHSNMGYDDLKALLDAELAK